MIVDLLRNDLSRTCLPESIRVTQLCRLENYEFVQHLVSAVIGRLRDDQTPLDLLRAAFPGGSITGRPKIRAMQIIAELEPTARGPVLRIAGLPGLRRQPGHQHPDSHDHCRPRLVASPGRRRHRGPVHARGRIRRNLAQSRRAAAGFDLAARVLIVGPRRSTIRCDDPTAGQLR